MADDLTQRGHGDDARVINTFDDQEVRYWCNEFGCTEDELFEAVNAAGTMSDRVRAHLAAKRLGTGGGDITA
jgi:Protein of unknown function (DUF3606)